MKAKSPKQFVYRYNGDPDSEESLMDAQGSILIPKAAETVIRKGKEWKVAYAGVQRPRGHMPVVSVFLVDKF